MYRNNEATCAAFIVPRNGVERLRTLWAIPIIIGTCLPITINQPSKIFLFFAFFRRSSSFRASISVAKFFVALIWYGLVSGSSYHAGIMSLEPYHHICRIPNVITVAFF